MVLRRRIWSPERAVSASEEFWDYLFQSGAIERMQRPMRFRAFLTNTLHNYAHDWMRRNPKVGPEGHDGLPAGAQPPMPEDEEIALWVRQLLHLALQRLDREQPRWGGMLRSFYGVPEAVDEEPVAPRRASEIADELGCTANALHQLLFRARKRLRDCVVEEVRETVSNRCDLESELEVLLAALGRTTPGILATPEPSPTREEP
jgi:RNA polymerase sigma factor (sigma-70 family)